MAYTKKQIAALAEGLRSQADRFNHIKPRSMSADTLVRIAADAESLAEHAASKDMHFTAIHCMAIALRMNRFLILRVAA